MTTYIQFAPIPRRPFTCMLTMDGVKYTCTIYWSLAAQDWMIKLVTLTNTLVIARKLTASASPFTTASLAYDPITRTVLVTLTEPHGYIIGSVIPITVSSVTPDDYNGLWMMTVQSPLALSFEIDTAPADAIIQGFAGYNLDLTAGYFNTSTLVFRGASQQLEQTP